MASESPIQFFGSRYDGVSADGWHVVYRDDNNNLVSVAGPFFTPWEASLALAEKVRKTQ